MNRLVHLRTYLVLGTLTLLAALAYALTGNATAATPLSDVDLSNYARVGRFDLPEPTRTPPPVNSLLAQEVSAVTYNPDTDTLFVVGDGGRSVVQVTKTGQLIDSMTLPPGASPQGTEFYDPEGLAYVGGGKFVMTEERDRRVVMFTYVPGGTLQRADAQTVTLGTFVENIGLEGVTFDPQTGEYILVKEAAPEGIFQTGVDFAAGTATNGSPATVNSVDLFNPVLAGLSDFADVFALSNVTSLTGPQSGNLLVLSQEAGKIVNIDRSGNIASSLTIRSDAGNPLSVADQQHEGLTMDNDGFLYTVSENGGGDVNHPQLWVYAPSSVPNAAPTALTLANTVTSIAENTSTGARVKVADLVVTDDELGNNNFSVTGPDAASFEADSTGLYIKAGTVLDFEAKTSYTVTVHVDDPAVGATPDATAAFTLAVTDVINETPAGSAPIIVSEVAPWASGNAPYAADWFEITNTGTDPVDLSGWRMDDNSNSFGLSVPLREVGILPPGKSAIFVEGLADGSTDATIDGKFSTAWFGTATPPAGFLIGNYGGGGVGLSTGGDAVNLFDATGNRVTGIAVPGSTTLFSFDNAIGASSTTLPLPIVSTLSARGTNGAFLAADGLETGSPGTIAARAIVSEVAPWASGNTSYAADWFEITNTGNLPVDLTGWKMDDNSNNPALAVVLRGVTVIPPGKSAIFIEGLADGTTDASIDANFSTAIFGSPTPPPGFLVGNYGGGGVGLGTGGDAVNLFDGLGNRITGIAFPGSTTFFSFDNAAGLGSRVLPLPVVSALSTVGVNGAFLAADGKEIVSPGRTANQAPSVALTNTVTTIAENTDTTSRIKIADITVSDDQVGVNLLGLSGADAASFEIDGNALYLKAGVTLDFEARSSYAVTVTVDDATIQGAPDATADLVVAIADVNEAPTALALANTVTSLPENTTSATRIRVADIVVTDDALGTNVLTLTGVDAAFFEIDGNVLYLKGGTNLDFEAKTGYAVTVTVDDLAVGVSPDATADLGIAITNVNEAPTPANDSGFTANQSLTKAIAAATLLANDTDPDAGTTLVIVPSGFSGAVGGSVALVGSDVVFTPSPTFSGTARFTYTVSDGSLTGQATVTIEVGRTIRFGNGTNTFAGTPGDDNVSGGSGRDSLSGGAGDDLINGGRGADTLAGGEGRDIFVISRESGPDTILDFNPAQDRIGLAGGLTFARLRFVNTAAGLAIRFDGDTLAVLRGVTAAQIGPANFITV